MSEAVTLLNSGANDGNEPQHKTIPISSYINAVNFANFSGEPLRIVFRHKIFARHRILPALPEPCIKDSLELQWRNQGTEEYLEQFDCTKILLQDGENLLSLKPADYCLTPDGMTVSLPETVEILNNRRIGRYTGNNTQAMLIHNGTFFDGRLIDFNPETLLINIIDEDNPELRWINREDEFNITLKNDNGKIYSGPCILTSTRETDDRILHTFKPIKFEIRKFTQKKYRGERVELTTPVQAAFTHPISGEHCRVTIKDVSGSGFQIQEKTAHAVLLPGLIIPQMELDLPGGSPLRCRAQVIYRKPDDNESNKINCGIAIIDMPPDDHSMLFNYFHKLSDSKASVCETVDTTALWRFFFESGFIYPEKYKHLSTGKERIKDLYDRLYTKHPGIARHFIYQEGSRILGHMSMLRSYEDSWLLHHHAANSNAGTAGLQVLNQVGSFSNNSYRIRSLHMLYLICYYREENKFPRKVFGDLAKKADNKSQLSLDSWAYFHHYKTEDSEAELPENWTLEATAGSDLRDLESFYKSISGGLMLKAMNLTDGSSSSRSLLKAYEEAGFKRTINLYSIKHQGACRAIIMADQSETGINMSNLTNSIKVFIINQDGLTKEILLHSIDKISTLYNGENKIPVLMFPENSADNLEVTKEKSYTLWILNTEASDAYFRYLKTLLKRIHH